jgi:hypothetical protein
MKLSTAARNGACDAIVDLIDGGSGAGTIEIRTGAAPTNPGDADSGTLLATLTFSDPAFGAASSGTATASAITQDSNVDASGTAAHFRIKDSNGTVIMQGSVGTSGADINFTTTTFVMSGTCSISSLTVTVPAGT